MRSRVQSQLHALLADLGGIPELTTLFGPAGRRWLAELGMPASARGRLDAGLRLIDAITIEVGRADADLGASFAGDDRVRRLLPIPGIGLVTAATVVAEVWDIDRFPGPERLCSWAGLTPGERTSDAHTRRGHTRQAGLALATLDAGRGRHHRRPRPRSSAASPPRSPSAAAPRSPGWHWPDGCSPCARTPSATTAAAVPTRSSPVAGGLGRARSVSVMALWCNGRPLD
jgi:transposase